MDSSNNTVSSPVFDDFVIQNIVSTVELGCSLDLKNIVIKARNAEYNPKHYSCLIMRIKNPKTTAIIFHNGKIIVLGAKSEETSRLAAKKFASIIKTIGYDDVKFNNFKIQNIVALYDVKYPVKLDRLYNYQYQYCTYEPEIFPGLIYHLKNPKLMMHIFVNGKIVFAGAKKREDIKLALVKINAVLKEIM